MLLKSKGFSWKGHAAPVIVDIGTGCALSCSNGSSTLFTDVLVQQVTEHLLIMTHKR